LDWIAASDVASPGGRKIVSMSLGGPRSQAVDDAVAEMTEVHGDAGDRRRRKRSERRRRHEPRRRRVRNRRREHELLPEKGTQKSPAFSSFSNVTRDGDERCVTDVVSPFSNYGDAVVVYAPGHGVRSAWASSDDAFKENSGTSMRRRW
jgi:hypothetical protein